MRYADTVPWEELKSLADGEREVEYVLRHFSNLCRTNSEYLCRPQWDPNRHCGDDWTPDSSSSVLFLPRVLPHTREYIRYVGILMYVPFLA